MPLNLPSSAQEITTKAKTDVQRAIPESNPFLKNSVLGAIISAFSNRIFDFYIQLRAAIDSVFPDTAEDEFLERWAAIFGKIRLGASQSSGNVAATGTIGFIVPSSTVLTTSDGAIFESTAEVVILPQSLTITSLTRSGSTVTAITAVDHNLADNVAVDVSGANEVEYNGTGIAINVTGLDSFTYTIVGTPTSPATGTTVLDFVSSSVPVLSDAAGASTNLPAGELLQLQSPLVGIDSTMGVDFGTVGGGTDQETDEQLRVRMLERIQNPVAHFNVSDITEKAREVPGVTRVFVQEVTPALGQVTVYFMRDNDTNPIPDASEVSTVRAKILEIKPANTGDGDVFVLAPTASIVDFTFTALSPNTSTMQAAVTANLDQFFAENTEVGVAIDEDAYRAAIAVTVDPDTGDTVDSFTLSSPSGDIPIASSEIGVLGTVTYS